MRTGIRLAALWPALAALVVGGGLLASLLPRLVEQSATNSLHAMLPMLTALVGTDADADELQERVHRLADDGELRISVIAEDGAVFADSARTAAQMAGMDNQRSRPEIVAATAAVRRGDTIGRDYVDVARQLRLPSGEPYLLRLALPLDELQVPPARLLRAAALTALAVLVAIAVAWWWLDRYYLGPLAALIADAKRLAKGELSHRLEPLPPASLAALATAINGLATRVEEQIAGVEAERNQLDGVLTSMSDGVLLADAEGAIRYVNAAFRRVFGDVGTAIGELAAAGGAATELAALLAEVLAERASADCQLELAGPPRRTFSLTAAPLPQGEVGVILVARDITDLMRVSAARRDFVANISHELKTPLSAIRGYVETLVDGALDEPETAAAFLKRVLEQCGRLERLLEDLLTLSRLESVEPGLEREPVDFVRLARRVNELVAKAAADRGVSVELAVGATPPLLGDDDALERMLLNLLDNAVKYNRPGGQVRLEVEAAGGEVVIAVRDTGLGIPAASLPRIFERFYRVDRGRSRKEGGTGLGLAIVKHAAQLHGGTVEVESEIGVGSTFRVRLPSPPAVALQKRRA